MSKLKFDGSVCSDIISKLETAETKISSATSSLATYYRNLPTAEEVQAKVRKMSIETDDYGNEIESLTNENYSYYMNNYGNSLINARTNLQRMRAASEVINSNVTSVDTKVKNIEAAVLNYESLPSAPPDYDAIVGGLDVPPEVPVDLAGVGSGLGIGDGSGIDVEDPTVRDGDGTGDDTSDTTPTESPKVDVDTDGDGVADLNIDTNGDKIPDVNIDTDGDGKPDLNIDTNGDLIPDVNIDTNGDGKPDLNIDTNGDGIPDVNIDTNGDGKPDLNVDTNGDGIPDINIDTNGDGKPDLNIDSDGNGYADINIDLNGDGIPDINVDTDGDGKPDKNVIPGYEYGTNSSDIDFINELLKKGKMMVDEDGNIMYYDENGNVIYPFLDGTFADAINSQKFKMAEDAFLGMLDGPDKENAVDSLDLDLDKNVSSASLAIGGMAAVGAAAANAAATMKRTKDEINDGVRVYDYEYDDDSSLTPEQYKKRRIGTIISMVLLTILIIANSIASILNITTNVTIVLIGLSIAITAVITTMGVKLGKFYTVCALLVNQFLIYLLTCLDVAPTLSYVIAFAVLVVVFLYYYFTKLFERILPMFDYVPAVVGIVAIGFVGLLSVFDITHWILNLILVVLIIAGYFAYNYFGIAKLEEQNEQERKKGLNIYDYCNLKFNSKPIVNNEEDVKKKIIDQIKNGYSDDSKLTKDNNDKKFFN
ncbi:MAG: hypothetical protein ACI4XM_01720 [Candidatus Coprovivens sp.]